MQKEHNETLAKLNFVLVLTNCVLDLAASKTAPLAALVDSTVQAQPQSETTRKAEQLVLLVRALQLLGSGLTLATQQLKSGQLRPSSTVKNGKRGKFKRLNFLLCFFAVVSVLNAKFKSTLTECKQLNSSALLAKVGSKNITADTILYNHAIQMVNI